MISYSTYKLNKQGDSIQPWCTPFPIWNQSVVPCLVLTCLLTCIKISQEAGKVVWYSHLFKNFPVCCGRKSCSIVSETEVDVFLEFSCFFCDPTDVDNLISLAFSKSSLNIWKLSVHILLKPSLDNFELYFASIWKAQSCQTLCHPMDCSLPGSSLHGILQATIPEWVAISFSRGSLGSRDRIQVSHIASRHFHLWATVVFHHWV